MTLYAEFTATGVNAEAVKSNAMDIARQVMGEPEPEGWEMVMVGRIEPNDASDLRGEGFCQTVVSSWRATFRMSWNPPSPEVSD